MSNFLGALLTIATRDLVKFLRDRTRIIVSFIFPVIFIGALGGSMQSNLGGLVGFKTYRENITPMLYTNSNISQKQSSLLINQLTSPGETVIRLDQLYPTSIFYSDRHVKALYRGIENSTLFIGQREILKEVGLGNIKWLYGATDKVNTYQSLIVGKETEVIKVDEAEAILHIK